MDVDDRIRRWLETGETLTFRLAAKLLFLLIFMLLAIVSFSANFWLTAIVAALLAGLMIRSVLPEQRFQSFAKEYWTGEAGERWQQRFKRLRSYLWGLVT